MFGYAITTFREGAVCTKYEGLEDDQIKLTRETWKTYNCTWKLAGLQGNGSFVMRPTDHAHTGMTYRISNVRNGGFAVTPSEKDREYILEIQGDYHLGAALHPESELKVGSVG
jgi:hypothetical protein